MRNKILQLIATSRNSYELADRICELVDENRKAYDWIISEDTGSSSKTIWAVMMGVNPEYSATPSDFDDFGRCKRLIEAMPKWKARLPEVANKHPKWKKIVERWDFLVEYSEREFKETWIIDRVLSLHPTATSPEDLSRVPPRDSRRDVGKKVIKNPKYTMGVGNEKQETIEEPNAFDDNGNPIKLGFK